MYRLWGWGGVCTGYGGVHVDNGGRTHTCLAMGGGQHVYSYVPWPALKMKRSWNEIFCTMCPSYNNGLSKCSIFVLTRQLINGDLMMMIFQMCPINMS